MEPTDTTIVGDICPELRDGLQTLREAIRELRDELRDNHTLRARVDDHEVRVLEPDSELDVKTGEPGELCCRGPYTINGYYRSPERNAQAFTSDGFYRTGDIVREIPGAGPEHPCYRLEDRLKDLIVKYAGVCKVKR